MREGRPTRGLGGPAGVDLACGGSEAIGLARPKPSGPQGRPGRK
jgi:hypothetical protein